MQIKNKPVCKSKSYIDEILRGTFFSFTYTELEIDPTNYEKVNQIFSGDSYTTVSNRFFKEMHHYKEVIEVITDSGIILTSTKTENFIKTDNIKEMTDFRLADNFLSYSIKLSTKKEIYNRSYPKLQYIAAELGGVLKSLNVICFIILYFYSRNKFYEHVKDFIFESKSDRNDRDYLKFLLLEDEKLKNKRSSEDQKNEENDKKENKQDPNKKPRSNSILPLNEKCENIQENLNKNPENKIDDKNYKSSKKILTFRNTDRNDNRRNSESNLINENNLNKIDIIQVENKNKNEDQVKINCNNYDNSKEKIIKNEKKSLFDNESENVYTKQLSKKEKISFIRENKNNQLDENENENEISDNLNNYIKIGTNNFSKYVNRRKKTYKLSFLENLFLPCIPCKKKKPYKIIENVQNKTDDILDIVRYMRELIDLKRMKKIIFNENEVKLLEYPYRLPIFTDYNEHIHYLSNSNAAEIDNRENQNTDLVKFKKLENSQMDENEARGIYQAIENIKNNNDNSKYTRKIIQASSSEIQNYLDFIEKN